MVAVVPVDEGARLVQRDGPDAKARAHGRFRSATGTHGG